MSRKTILTGILILVIATGFAAFFGPIIVGGKSGPPKPGSPAYTEALASKVLSPVPPSFGGEVKDTALASKLWWPPTIVPPKGAPNVLLIMITMGKQALVRVLSQCPLLPSR